MQRSESMYTRYETSGGRSRGRRGVPPPSRSARSGRRLGLALLIVVLAAGAVVAVGLWQQSSLPGFVLAQIYPLEYRDAIASASEEYGVDPYLVAAVARAESGFSPGAVSSAGAVGVMQIMPETADWLAARDGWRGSAEPELTDPAESIHLGAFYLAVLIERFGGEEATALAAYNAGPSLVQGWVDEEVARAEAAGRSAQGVGDIPFPETRGFVDRVQRFRAFFEKGHPDAFDG